MKAAVDQILARLRDQKVEVPADEVESRMRLLVEKFGVPEGEATRSVVNYFLKEHGIAPASFAARKSESLKVGEINSSGQWIDLEAVQDGNLISSRGPDDLPAFCQAIIAALIRQDLKEVSESAGSA